MKTTLIEFIEWQTDSGPTCAEGCWCRKIVTVPEKGKRKRTFVVEGQLTKKQAELIVSIHNEWLSNL